jgi:glucose-1-phosphate cytidylyltransferase
MRIFAAQGASEFVLCLGYRGEIIRRYFLDYELMNADVTVELGTKQTTIHDRTSEAGWRITFVDTGDKAQTGARIARARRHVGERGCFVTYGDTLANIDLAALSEHHAREGRHVTVTAVHPWSVRFGELEVHESRVVRFREKPEEKESYINGGFFVFEPEAFEYLSTDDACVLERDPLERLAADGQLSAHRHDGFWACMDTYRDWMALNEMCERGERPWQIEAP